ncbi:uncharacterized protein LOC114462204 [Gouania willdenowi]|uniref:uncharacterized protein LOC114462204 n=1 Tax=Gouania willdenowi TaxID=441366 RepID=UPI001056755A|nr:uncharacterized protein LOC114462204 [Gouania willdenowi]
MRRLILFGAAADKDQRTNRARSPQESRKKSKDEGVNTEFFRNTASQTEEKVLHNRATQTGEEASGCSTWKPLLTMMATIKRHSVLKDCPYCKTSVLSYGHFIHKNEIYCEGTGETLGLWLYERQVSRTTRWRLETTYNNMKKGIVPGPAFRRHCPKCGQQKTRETGHTILRSARASFCQRTDPQGRTVEEWLTQMRGGVTSQDMKAMALSARRVQAKAKRDRQRMERQAEHREMVDSVGEEARAEGVTRNAIIQRRRRAQARKVLDDKAPSVQE